MEFVRVTYPQNRQVRVDLQPQGLTNQVLDVEAGLHRFDLGQPPDYTPPFDERIVTGTSFADPMEIAFDPVAVAVSVTTVTVSTAPAGEPARGAKKARRIKKAKPKQAKRARKAKKAKKAKANKARTAKRAKKTTKRRTSKRRSRAR
jgi:hypothetical protein